MAMTFTAIAKDPVLVTEGTFGMTYKASGAILAGEAVEAIGTEACQVASQNHQFQGRHTNAFLGVAGQSASHGDQVTVYGVGNKVRVRASGSITTGHTVVAVSKGFFQNSSAKPSGAVQGVALEAITSNGYGKVLLT